MDETVKRIKGYVEIINTNPVDDRVLDFIIGEILDRVLLYLNSEQIPVKTERIIAQVINTSLKKCFFSKSAAIIGSNTIVVFPVPEPPIIKEDSYL